MKLYNKPQHIRVMVAETLTVRRLDTAAFEAALAWAPLTDAQRDRLREVAGDQRTLIDHLVRYSEEATLAEAATVIHGIAARVASGELYPEVEETREVETWEWVDPEDPRVAPEIRTHARAQRLAEGGGAPVRSPR